MGKRTEDRWINNDDLKRIGFHVPFHPTVYWTDHRSIDPWKRAVFKLCMISNVYHIPLEELMDHNGKALSQEDFHLIGRAMLEAKMYYEAAQVGFYKIE